FHKPDEPLLAHRVEERADVGVQYPVHLGAGDPDQERIHRIVCAASGPEPIREPEELFLVDRAQHRSRGPLDDLVLKGGDRDRALPTIRLGYVNAPRRSTRGLQSMPLAADGVLYYSGSYSRVYALDGA